MFDLKIIAEAISLSILLLLERFFPFFQNPSDRLAHAAKNLGIGILNYLVISIFFSGLTLVVAGWTHQRSFGILNLWNLPESLRWAAAIVLLDLWMYVWHWANHNVGGFWRFHRVHHSDLEMDSTSAFRFHAGEIIFSTIARLGVIPLLGLELKHLLVYETLIQPFIMFHHSNVAFPERFDRVLRALIVTPNMHRTHHSDLTEETNSNYSTLFSFWDRIGRTFRLRTDPKTLQYGVRGFSSPAWQSFAGMIRTPFLNPQP